MQIYQFLFDNILQWESVRIYIVLFCDKNSHLVLGFRPFSSGVQYVRYRTYVANSDFLARMFKFIKTFSLLNKAALELEGILMSLYGWNSDISKSLLVAEKGFHFPIDFSTEQHQLLSSAPLKVNSFATKRATQGGNVRQNRSRLQTSQAGEEQISHHSRRGQNQLRL